MRAVGARVVDVPVRPVYGGQASGIRLWTVIYPILFVLVGSFLRRLWAQHLAPGRQSVRLLRESAEDPDGSTAAARLPLNQ